MSAAVKSQAPVDGEIVDAVEVLDEQMLLEPRRVFPLARRGFTVIPAVQTVAVAAGGFVAGAALIGLAARSRRPAALSAGARAGRRLSGRSRPAAEQPAVLKVIATRSLLVHVHTLGPAEPSDR